MSDLTTTPEKKITPLSRLKGLMGRDDVKSRFTEVLGSKAPAFLASVLSSVNANKYLQECEPMSVISAASIAAAMDLPVSPGLGFAHIVPYKGVAQFQIGWKGIVQLAMRSGQYKTINLTPVYEGQVVTHNQFTGEMTFRKEKKSELIEGYLLYFKLLNGYEKYFYMTQAEAEAHGNRYSASYNNKNSQWQTNFEAMALKTVAKLGLSKYGILSIDMQKAVEYDEAEVTDDGPRYIDAKTVNEPAPPEKKQTRLEALASAQPVMEAEVKQHEEAPI